MSEAGSTRWRLLAAVIACTCAVLAFTWFSGNVAYAAEDVSTDVRAELSPEEFIATIGEQARYIAEENGLYGSVMVAQATVESRHGTSKLGLPPNYNLFGIKGHYEGESVDKPTQEDDGSGNYIDVVATFRKYPSHAESLQDYADLLKSKPQYYEPAWKENAETYVDACDALQGTYATSSTYSSTLQTTIAKYGLERYDEPLGYTVVDMSEDVSSGDVSEVAMDAYVGLERLASKALGIPYVQGGATPHGLDGYGLVRWCYAGALAIELPDTLEGLRTSCASVDADVDTLRLGDVLMFDGKEPAMYLSGGFYVRADAAEGEVVVSSMDDDSPIAAVRPLAQRDADGTVTGGMGMSADAGQDESIFWMALRSRTSKG